MKEEEKQINDLTPEKRFFGLKVRKFKRHLDNKVINGTIIIQLATGSFWLWNLHFP